MDHALRTAAANLLLGLAALAALAAAGAARAESAADALTICFEGSYKTALTACDRAVAHEETGFWDRALALGRRGALRRLGGDAKAALADYDAALALTPDKPALLVGRGEAKAELGDASGALADFDAALAKAPGNAAIIARRGHVRGVLGDLGGAIEDFERALEIDAASAEAKSRLAVALNARAWARWRRGEPTPALADVEAALALRPDDPQIVDTLAHVLTSLGRGEDALAAYLKTVDKGGASWRSAYTIALKARGFTKSEAPLDDAALAAALRACVKVDCRLMAD